MAFVRAEFMSYSLKRTVPITAILPCDTANFMNIGPQPAKPPYKTLYLLHGIYGSDMDWVAKTNIQRMAREHQIAVIMPAAENHFYTDKNNDGEKYGEFIGKELPEVTRRMFQLSDKREDTYICGFSMGGYGAFMSGFKYHGTFSHVACMSSVIMNPSYLSDITVQPTPMNDREFHQSVFGCKSVDGTEEDLCQAALVKKLLSDKKEIPKLFMSVGTNDPLMKANRELHEFLEKNGVEHIYREREGYFHNFDFWGEEIAEILDWLPHGEKIVIGDSGNVLGV